MGALAEEDVSQMMAHAHRAGEHGLALITYEVDNGLGARRIGATGICILVEDGSAVLITLGMDSQTPAAFYVPGSFEVVTPGTDGQTFEAELMGVDPASGAGFIRVRGDYDWEAVEFASEADLAIGDAVVSVGLLEPNLGRVPYVGTGRVSSVTQSPETILCVANGGLTRPGSPVFDDEGMVVGVVGPQWFINSQLMVEGQAANVGTRGQHWTMCFVPVDEFVFVLSNIPETPSDVQPLGWIGALRVEGVPEDQWRLYAIDTPGVVLHDIVPGRCGARAGLKNLDIIVGINGDPLPQFPSSDMTAGYAFRTLGRMGASTDVMLNVIRDGSPMDIRVTLEPTPMSTRNARMYVNQRVALLVREKVEMDPYVDTAGSGHVPGMFVLRVDENGPSGRAGILPGDTITAIDGENVTTAQFIEDRLTRSIERGGTMEVMISREGRDMAIVVDIPEAPESTLTP
jgi:serine protease Do